MAHIFVHREFSTSMTVVLLPAASRGAGAMADVFISYAKPDRPLALKLAAILEAEGWTTWWDTTLIPGDDFYDPVGSGPSGHRYMD
jgi:hypothetical protein